MKRATVILILALLFTTDISAQNVQSTISISRDDETRFSLRRDLELDDSSKAEEIDVEIQANARRFELRIQSMVTSGKLTIEIYDAKGEKKGVFSVGSESSAAIDEKAKGQIVKSMREPEPGIWKVKLKPAKAKGTVKINTETMYKD